LLSVSYLLSALGSLSEGNLITGQGYTTFTLKMTILGIGIGFPLGFLLISQFGVIGLIITTLVVSLPGLIIGLHFIKKHFDVSVDWVSSAKILFSAAIAGVLTFLITTHLAFSNPILLIIGLIIFPVVFLVSTLVTKTLDTNDISNLREIAQVLGPLRKPLFLLLDIMEKFRQIIYG